MCCKKTAAKRTNTSCVYTKCCRTKLRRVWWCPAQTTACLWPMFGAVYTAAGTPPYRGSLSSQPPSWLWRCGVRAGNAEVIVPLDLPHCSIGDDCLEWHGQFDQVDGGGAPNSNVWALVSGGNVPGGSCTDLEDQLWSAFQVAGGTCKVKDDCQDIIMPAGVAPRATTFWLEFRTLAIDWYSPQSWHSGEDSFFHLQRLAYKQS